ncbi:MULTISPECIES: hypothetical protein [Streptomyces]|uniref:Uncharacterized protein n=1 Tax=Streptomyces dengpaensis TaxID=2049881 RepID=A0ABN5I5T5_9ACTN|nr:MULTISPECIES: hypothetical protein [Streptomyces]AVH58415.1 hypothetical protein C4B68_24550 [Streptomyces dengpaensis]PIB06088.1 hypothetical protein B1C81_26270 [Streptomyces sp. HG99]
MSAVIPREQAIAEARAVLDQARARIAADYAAGRLDPDKAALIAHLWRPASAPATHRAAA